MRDTSLGEARGRLRLGDLAISEGYVYVIVKQEGEWPVGFGIVYVKGGGCALLENNVVHSSWDHEVIS
jgi:hypothetical protein